MKKRSNTLKKVGLALAGLGALCSTSTAFAGNDAIGKNSNGFTMETRGGLAVYDPCCDWYWFRLGGRLEFDEVLFSGDFRDKQGNFPSSGNVRRAYLSFNGGVGECLSYNLTLDFGRSVNPYTVDNLNSLGLPEPLRTRVALAGTNSFVHGIALIEEAWLGWSGLWDCTLLRFGQFTPLATMDAATNYGVTNGQMFLESALATRAFDVPSYIQTDSRSMKGFGVILNSELFDMFTFGATVYQPAHGSLNVYGDPRRSDRVGGAVRLTFSPIHECDTALHAGFLARYQSLNHTDASRTLVTNSDAILNTLFFTTPEVTPRNYVGAPSNASVLTGPFGTGNNASSTYDPNLVNTGAIRAKSYNHLAAEFAALWCQWTFQGEYHWANVQRKPFALAYPTTTPAPTIVPSNSLQRGNVKFHGGHAQVGYVLTGESRSYDFRTGAIRGIKPCSPYGAWEIAARYSYLTLIDKDVYGGSEHNVTLGLNWYINDNVRFAFNYVRANINPTGTIAGQQGLLIAGQTQASPTYKRRLDIMAARIQVVF